MRRSRLTSPLRSRNFRWFLVLWTTGVSIFSGCHPIQPYYLHEDGDLSHYLDVATAIEYPDLEECPLPDAAEARVPFTLADPNFDQFWDLTLEEAISIALQNGKVLPSLGGVRQLGQVQANTPTRTTSSPDGVTTIYDVAIQESGQGGVEQALANFDAVFRSTTTWDSSDRAQNFAQANQVNSPVLQQDQVTINNEISKLSAVGTQYFLRNVSIYDGANNELTRQTRALPSSWFTAMEMEIRQPLFRGRGAQINRIPVVLARMRTDVALADFQDGVMQFLSDVETAYWELYFNYRNLDAARTGRDSALAAWQRIKALADEPGGSKDRETQARGQLYTFEVQLKEAQRSLQTVETRLRFLMGIAPTDGRFIRPCDEPCIARIEFDWNEILCESLERNVPLRRIRWRIKQSEMQLIAAKNQLLPQVDVVGLYRWLGVGDEFDSWNRNGLDFPAPGSTAVDSLLQGDFQEFRLGFSAELQLGRREALSQVRAQQLALVRERARLETAELEVAHQLTEAYQTVVGEYLIMQQNLNRWIAFQGQVAAAEVAKDQANFELFNLLDAQRQRAQAQSDYFQSVVRYNLAIMFLHRIKGSLLDYDCVLLAEGPWPEKAYFDAQNRARQRDASYFLDYGYTRPRVSSRGPIEQYPGGVQHEELEPQGESVISSPWPEATEILPFDGELKLTPPMSGETKNSVSEPMRETSSLPRRPAIDASILDREMDLSPPQSSSIPSGTSPALPGFDATVPGEPEPTMAAPRPFPATSQATPAPTATGSIRFVATPTSTTRSPSVPPANRTAQPASSRRTSKPSAAAGEIQWRE